MKGKNNVLITGITGNMGRMLEKELLDNGYNVFGIASSGQETKNIINKDLMLITDEEITLILIKNNIDTVIHCAADIQTKTLDGFVLNSFILNKFFVNKLGKDKKYIVIGSAAEYGLSDGQTLVEEKSNESPINDYGRSKLLQTSLCYYYKKIKKIDITVLRVFNIFSPFLPKTNILGSLINQVKDGLEINVSNLKIERDYLDLRDLARLVSLVVKKDHKRFLYNVASGKNITYQEMIDAFNNVLRKNNLPLLKINLLNNSENLNNYKASIKKVRNDFGWEPKQSLEDSISWCLKENNLI